MKLLHNLTLIAALFVFSCTPELAGCSTVSAEQKAGHYKLIALPLEQTSSPIGKREPLPFRLRAPGSAEARIVDASDQLIRPAPVNGTIFGFRSSPNRQWVLLDLSNAAYVVASVDGLKDIARPPKRPHAPADATVIEWRILDDDRLIGYAELPSLEPTEGLTASEADGLPPRGTLVYIYTIATGAMSPVEIDASVTQPFSISDDSYGNLAIEPHPGLAAFGVKILQIPQP
ncbi:hypothetical protein [Stenotrophomonas rhizophila]|uniref:hypothetical protein n=1 Tax=Stenotrophomonas rhizophila TaxID=216778 RepID=UPI0028D3E890|nr:hypothetical protein [Stenotrophomonas rhizophila]